MAGYWELVKKHAVKVIILASLLVFIIFDQHTSGMSPSFFYPGRDPSLQKSDKVDSLSANQNMSVLRETCFVYLVNVTTDNVCCKMHRYTTDDIKTCSLQQMGKIKPIVSSNEKSEKSLKKLDPGQYIFPVFFPPGWNGGIHWVIMGDSKIRMVYYKLLDRMNLGSLEFIRTSYQNKWTNGSEINPNMDKVHESMAAYYRDAHLLITFIWDPYLSTLLNYINQWELDVSNRPSFLVLETGTWFLMINAGKYEKGMAQFQAMLESVGPRLSQLAAHVPVVIQLLDHIREQNVRSNNIGTFTNQHMDHYNTVIRDRFNQSLVRVWDSTLPLSRRFSADCERQPAKKKKGQDPFCKDDVHVSYTLIIQYVDMLLNHICNRHLKADKTLCLN